MGCRNERAPNEGPTTTPTLPPPGPLRSPAIGGPDVVDTFTAAVNRWGTPASLLTDGAIFTATPRQRRAHRGKCCDTKSFPSDRPQCTATWRMSRTMCGTRPKGRQSGCASDWHWGQVLDYGGYVERLRLAVLLPGAPAATLLGFGVRSALITIRNLS